MMVMMMNDGHMVVMFLFRPWENPNHLWVPPVSNSARVLNRRHDQSCHVKDGESSNLKRLKKGDPVDGLWWILTSNWFRFSTSLAQSKCLWHGTRGAMVANETSISASCITWIRPCQGTQRCTQHFLPLARWRERPRQQWVRSHWFRGGLLYRMHCAKGLLQKSRSQRILYIGGKNTIQLANNMCFDTCTVQP